MSYPRNPNIPLAWHGTSDKEFFGEDVFVYCTQHMRPHKTGWCTVSVCNKYRLQADTLEGAFLECREKGYPIF